MTIYGIQHMQHGFKLKSLMIAESNKQPLNWSDKGFRTLSFLRETKRSNLNTSQPNGLQKYQDALAL